MARPFNRFSQVTFHVLIRNTARRAEVRAHGFKIRDVFFIVRHFLDEAADGLVAKQQIYLTGLGAIRRTVKRNRGITHPITGKTYRLGEGYQIEFRAMKPLKKRIGKNYRLLQAPTGPMSEEDKKKLEDARRNTPIDY